MIELLIANSLFIYGIHAATRFDQALYFIAKRIYGTGIPSHREAVLRNALSKVLIDCPPCMSSLYGLVFFARTDLNICAYPLWVMCLCGLNFIIITLIKK